MWGVNLGDAMDSSGPDSTQSSHWRIDEQNCYCLQSVNNSTPPDPISIQNNTPGLSSTTWPSDYAYTHIGSFLLIEGLRYPRRLLMRRTHLHSIHIEMKKRKRLGKDICSFPQGGIRLQCGSFVHLHQGFSVVPVAAPALAPFECESNCH